MRGRSARGINRNRSVAYRRQALPNSLTMTNMAAASIRIWSMAFFVRRAFHISSASWLLLCGMGGSAMSQDAAPPPSSTQLPEITVTSPSPIVRRNVVPSRTPARIARAVPGRNRERTPQPTPVAAAPQRGVLPIVTDQFATVTVVPNEEIRREGGGTLGDLLFSKPGITGSEFAPGASSRPIIRGLDVNRVRIQENGTGANGSSDLGEDPFVPVDPLTSNQVEVIRGPATLRFGSTAIGGVVEATKNRIPDALPCTAAAAFPARRFPGVYKAPPPGSPPQGCLSFETRGAVTSVNDGIEGAALLDAGGGNFAFHADVSGRRSDDYRTPAYPYLVPPDPAAAPRATQPGAFNGKQPNSAYRF